MCFLSSAHLRTLLVCFAIVPVIPLASQIAAAQSPPVNRKAPHPPPPSDQEQFIPYWTTETGWQSELQLRNNLAVGDLTVTPALRAPDGTETLLSPVTVKPQEVRTLDLESAVIGNAPQYVGTYGSVALRYRSPSPRNLFAMLMIHNVGHSVAFHIDATGELQDPQPGSREGIWWLPNDTATDYLVLTNQSSTPLHLDLSLYDSAGRETKQKITLPARATNRLSARQLAGSSGLSGTFGGIKLSAASHAGSLDSVHLFFDEKASFSAFLKTFDRNPSTTLEERDFAHTKVWTLRAPMLALSHPDPALAFPEGTVLQPQLFVRNTLATPVDVSLRFNWRNASATGKAAGPSFRLGPYETRRVDVAALQASGTLPEDAYWASVILTTSGLPDEVVAIAASYNQTLRYGAQTPFSDQLAFHWVGSLWEYDPQHNSLISAGNGGTKPLRAAFTIYYNQGTQKYELEQTLQPDEQMWIDVGKLIREQERDKNGNVLPQDLTSGSYELRDLTNKGVGELFEGKIVYDKTYGHVTYGCGGCCGYHPAYLWYDPLGIPLSFFSSQGVDAYDTCGAYVDDVSTLFEGKWSTANTSIATVDYYGKHTGHAVGSTTSQSFAFLQMASRTQTCPTARLAPSGGDNVKPTVSITGALNFAFVGSDPTVPKVLQQAVGNPGGGTYSWTANPSSRISFDNASTDIVHMAGINPSTSVGDTTLTVNYTFNNQSANPPATLTATSRIFKFLIQSGVVQIIPQSNGFVANVFYNVYTNPGGQILGQGFGGISVPESVTVTSATLNGVPLTPEQLSSITTHRGAGGTNSNSQIVDDLSLLNNSGGSLPSGLVINSSQDLFVGGIYVRSNTIQQRTENVVTVTNLGPTS